MWVPCSRCACRGKAYTATGPDSPSDALLFSSCLISLKPVGVSPLPLQGAHDIVLSAVSICSFVRSLLHFVYCSDNRYSQVVIGLRCCCWKFIASPTSALASSLLDFLDIQAPSGRFQPCYCDLCICFTRTLRFSHAITEIINWIILITTRYDFLCPERHTGLWIPEILKVATYRLDRTRFLCLGANRHPTYISFNHNVYPSG
jgi:hypothetical protein